MSPPKQPRCEAKNWAMKGETPLYGKTVRESKLPRQTNLSFPDFANSMLIELPFVMY